MITGEKLSIFDRTLAGVGLVTSTLSFGVGSTIKNSVKASYKILTKIPYSKLAKNLFLKPTKKLFANMGSITDRLYSLHQKGVKPSASTSKHLAKRILNEKEILNGGKYTDVELETIEVLHKQLEKSLPNVKGVSVNEEVWRAVPEKYTNSKGISILNTDKSVFDLHPGTLSGNHRYSMPGERGLYTSMGPEVTAWKTVMEELGPLADKPLRLAPARAILNNVLDLTDGKVLKVLSIKNSQLVRQDYLMTHTIGSVARSKGFKGIKYPSQHTKDTNLVIFYGE